MNKHHKGTLYFVPVTLGDNASIQSVIPQDVIRIIHQLNEFIVENEKTARQFLSACNHPTPIREITFKTLNEHSTDKELPALLTSINQGRDIGLMSEAGCPGIADPGAKLAALAHYKGVKVAPLVGPSSILLSLMASGLNGQQFAFLGYIPVDKSARIHKIKEIEKRAKFANETQIMIETPYRNMHLLEDILTHANAKTQLCIACNISLDDEFIQTKSIHDWQNTERPDLHKKPTVFLLLA